MTELKCKKCQSQTYVKSGHVRGHQRYKCKSCGCQFTDTKPLGVNPAIKSFAVVLYAFCGVSMGNIARIFKVSTVAVLKWVRAAAAQIEAQAPAQKPDIVMIDEFWHFVNGKKTKFGCGEPLTGYRVNLSDGNWAIVLMPAFKSLSQKSIQEHAPS
jgi:transposase-like protein